MRFIGGEEAIVRDLEDRPDHGDDDQDPKRSELAASELAQQAGLALGVASSSTLAAASISA